MDCVVIVTSVKPVQLFHIARLKWANYEMEADFQTQVNWLLETRPPYGSNLQRTLVVSGSVTTTHTMATMEGCSTTTMMNDCFM